MFIKAQKSSYSDYSNQSKLFLSSHAEDYLAKVCTSLAMAPVYSLFPLVYIFLSHIPSLVSVLCCFSTLN
jgi:hypothetical protein